MVIGAFILMVFAMVEVGGYDGLVEKYSKAEADPAFSAMKLENGKNVSCMAIQENFMHMLRPADAPGDDLPWTGLFTGMLIGRLTARSSDWMTSGHLRFHLVLVC